MAAKSDESGGRKAASWVFGSLTLIFLIGAYVFDGRELTPTRHNILGLIGAISAGLFGYFFSGTVGLQLVSSENRFGRIVLRATGTSALFVFVLLWWHSSYSPINKQEINLFNQVLQLFEKEIGYPPPQYSTGFSRTDYARRVQSFADKHGLNDRDREALLKRIKSATSTSDQDGPLLQARRGVAGSTGKESESSTSGADQPEAGRPDHDTVSKPPDDSAKAANGLHGAAILLRFETQTGSDRAKVGDLINALISIHSLDDFNDSLIFTNIVLLLEGV